MEGEFVSAFVDAFELDVAADQQQMAGNLDGSPAPCYNSQQARSAIGLQK
jgi:hypothetical protein